jgi:hypothetical protein
MGEFFLFYALLRTCGREAWLSTRGSLKSGYSPCVVSIFWSLNSDIASDSLIAINIIISFRNQDYQASLSSPPSPPLLLIKYCTTIENYLALSDTSLYPMQTLPFFHPISSLIIDALAASLLLS